MLVSAVPRRPRIGLIASGSSAAQNIVGLCQLIKDERPTDLAVVLTQQVELFITTHTLKYVANVQHVLRHDEWIYADRPAHIWFSDWSDMIVVFPACGDMLGKMACGIAPDLPTTIALGAFASPLIIAPSLNQRMYSSPIVRRNIETLERAGATIVMGPQGLIAENDKVAAAIAAVHNSNASTERRSNE